MFGRKFCVTKPMKEFYKYRFTTISRFLRKHELLIKSEVFCELDKLSRIRTSGSIPQPERVSHSQLVPSLVSPNKRGTSQTSQKYTNRF